MITIDLEQFVVSGSIPKIDHQTTRADLLELLGPNEPGYPDVMSYGHVGFDFPGGSKFLRGVLISFPRFFTGNERQRQIDSWPEKRFE